MKNFEKSKFAQISDVRYYFNDGIVSLSFLTHFCSKSLTIKK